MIIKKIKIENFGRISHFEASLDPNFTAFKENYARDIIKGIGVILKNIKVLKDLKKSDIKKDTCIEAEVETGNECFSVMAGGILEVPGLSFSIKDRTDPPERLFYSKIRCSPEENELGIFYLQEKNTYSDRLKFYKEADRYYPDKTFGTLTKGIGDTKTFRNCLCKFISTYIPEQITECSKYVLRIKNNGSFTVIDSSDEAAEVKLDNYGNISFQWLCFLNVNRFWQEVEKIRNPGYERCPLLVSGKAGSEVEADKISEILKNGERIDRQVVIGLEIPEEERP